MKVTRARILAGVAGWLLVLSPLLFRPKGGFVSGVIWTGGGALIALGAWRFFRFVRTRFRRGRRRTMKAQGKITARHVEKVYADGGHHARWEMKVTYPTGPETQEKIEWAPYDAYTNMESTINRVGSRNPLGKEVLVHFDPDDPSNARVGTRMSLMLYPAFAFAALVLALSLITFATLSLIVVWSSLVTLWRLLP